MQDIKYMTTQRWKLRRYKPLCWLRDYLEAKVIMKYIKAKGVKNAWPFPLWLRIVSKIEHKIRKFLHN